MIPAGLTHAQQQVWRGALIVQAGDPTRPVSFADIARVIRIHRVSVRSTVRRIKQKGINWPFPEHPGGCVAGQRRPSKRSLAGRSLPQPLATDLKKRRRKRLEQLAKGYVNVRLYPSVRRYILEWKLLRRTGREAGTDLSQFQRDEGVRSVLRADLVPCRVESDQRQMGAGSGSSDAGGHDHPPVGG